jgi:hypothetical protein
MFNKFAVLEVLFGIFLIIIVLLIAHMGAPTWLILVGLAVSIILCLYATSALRPKNKKLKAALQAIIGVCFIIMGLLEGVWGGKNTIVMVLYILVGIIGLISATHAYLNVGYRHHVTNK